MIVVDANVIVYLVVKGQETARARALAIADPVWIAPKLWRFELTSALTTLVLGGVLNREGAARALAQADDLITPNETDVDQFAVLQAALRYDISAHDAQYVALASSLGVKCVTADGPLARKVPDVALALKTAVA